MLTYYEYYLLHYAECHKYYAEVRPWRTSVMPWTGIPPSKAPSRASQPNDNFDSLVLSWDIARAEVQGGAVPASHGSAFPFPPVRKWRFGEQYGGKETIIRCNIDRKRACTTKRVYHLAIQVVEWWTIRNFWETLFYSDWKYITKRMAHSQYIYISH